MTLQVYEYGIIGVIVFVCGFISTSCSILVMLGVMYMFIRIRNFRERNRFVFIVDKEDEEEELAGAQLQS